MFLPYPPAICISDENALLICHTAKKQNSTNPAGEQVLPTSITAAAPVQWNHLFGSGNALLIS
jgi:hypothetical protein